MHAKKLINVLAEQANKMLQHQSNTPVIQLPKQEGHSKKKMAKPEQATIQVKLKPALT